MHRGLTSLEVLDCSSDNHGLVATINRDTFQDKTITHLLISSLCFVAALDMYTHIVAQHITGTNNNMLYRNNELDTVPLL